MLNTKFGKMTELIINTEVFHRTVVPLPTKRTSDLYLKYFSPIIRSGLRIVIASMHT